MLILQAFTHDVAPDHIEPDSVTEYMVECLGAIDIRTPNADSGDQFNLGIEVIGARRIA